MRAGRSGHKSIARWFVRYHRVLARNSGSSDNCHNHHRKEPAVQVALFFWQSVSLGEAWRTSAGSTTTRMVAVVVAAPVAVAVVARVELQHWAIFPAATLRRRTTSRPSTILVGRKGTRFGLGVVQDKVKGGASRVEACLSVPTLIISWLTLCLSGRELAVVMVDTALNVEGSIGVQSHTISVADESLLLLTFLVLAVA